MRLVQVDLDGHRLDFHPYVTVVRRADVRLRARIVSALAALPAGRAGIDGLVEAHGVFMDLTDETLALLDIPNATTDGLDIVVRASQLPTTLGPGGLVRDELVRTRESVAARVARAEADADRARLALHAGRGALEEADAGSSTDGASARVDGVQDELERLTHEREALERRVDAARLAHADAQHDQLMAEQRLARAREQRVEADRLVSAAASELEAMRRRRDPFAAGALELARARLAALEAAHAGVADDHAEVTEPSEEPAAESTDDVVDATPTSDETADTADPGDADGRVAALEARRAELEARLLALDTVDPLPVDAALDHLMASKEVELVPSPDAVRVAEQWARNEAALAGQGAGNDISGHVLAAARQRLDAARAAVFEAERAARAPEVGREDVEALENAHEAVLVAQDRTERRVGGARAKHRLEEARAAEQAILDRLGFPTYSAFVMGTSIQHIDLDSEKRLDAARAELASAEDAVAHLDEGIDAELARAALLARRRELRDEAIEILGSDPGEDIEWALRQHRVEVHGGTERTQRLRAALERAGIVFGDDRVPQQLLVDLARTWLAEQRSTGAQRETVEASIAQLDRELHEARTARDAAAEAAAKGATPGAVDPSVALEDAKAAVVEAEVRVEHQREIVIEIERRRDALRAASDAEQRVRIELAEAESAEAAHARREHEAAAELAKLQAQLDAAISAERELADALVVLQGLLQHVSSPDDREALERSVREAESAVAEAEAVVAAARGELAGVDRQLEALESGEQSAPAIVTTTAGVEALEWYLLSRLANQRAVSYAGSLPLVLDDALAHVRGDGLTHVLSRLERMSNAVQVIVFSDDPEVAAWAESIGADRAVTLSPAMAG